MWALIEVVLPVFAVIGAGLGFARAGLMGPETTQALMAYAQRLAIPALLFLGVARLDLAHSFAPGVLVAYYSGSLAMFAAGAAGARFIFRRGWPEAVVIGFAAMFANSVMLGLPVTERAFGADALGPNLAIVSLHAPFCYLVGITAMELVRHGGGGALAAAGRVLRSMGTNALMLAIAAGFAANLAGLSLPGFAEDALELVARSALPVALFALGMTLAGYRVAGDLREVAWIGALSLLAHPAIAWLLGSHALDLTDGQLRSTVLTAAMPPGINAYIFATMYGAALRVSASAVLLTTLAATLAAASWLAVLP